MQHIQSPATRSYRGTMNHPDCGMKNAIHIQLKPPKSTLGKKHSLHFETGGNLKRRNLSSMKFGMKGVVKLQLHEQRIRNRHMAGTQKLVDFLNSAVL